MRGPVALALALLSLTAMADHGDVIINSASELRDWCKTESEASLIGRGLTPSNWSASYWDQGNVLFAKGQWHVDASFIQVECQTARGARSQFASLTVLEK